MSDSNAEAKQIKPLVDGSTKQGDVKSQALEKLQAQLHGDSNLQKGASEIGKHSSGIDVLGGGKGGGFSHHNFDRDPASPEAKTDAETKLNERVSLALKEGDQQTLKAMSHALLNGDTKAFGDAVKSLGGDPEKLKAFVADLNKNLQDNHAGVQVSVSKDGNVVVFDKSGSTGVQYDSKTGEASVVPVSHENGNDILGQGEVLNQNPQELAKQIGDTATGGVLGIGSLDIPPLFPGHPHIPNFPRGGDDPKLPPDWPKDPMPRDPMPFPKDPKDPLPFPKNPGPDFPGDPRDPKVPPDFPKLPPDWPKDPFPKNPGPDSPGDPRWPKEPTEPPSDPGPLWPPRQPDPRLDPPKMPKDPEPSPKLPPDWPSDPGKEPKGPRDPMPMPKFPRNWPEDVPPSRRPPIIYDNATPLDNSKLNNE